MAGIIIRNVVFVFNSPKFVSSQEAKPLKLKKTPIIKRIEPKINPFSRFMYLKNLLYRFDLGSNSFSTANIFVKP